MSLLTGSAPRARGAFTDTNSRFGTHHPGRQRLNSAAGRWRGCFGLALVVTHPSSGVCRFGRLIVPDRDVRWVTLLDLPYGASRLGSSRNMKWAAAYLTRTRYGMPLLG